MINLSDHTVEERVLLLAPTARDGRLSTTLLAEVGIGCTICADLPALCQAIGEGGGVVLLHEEALRHDGLAQLATTLAKQAVWSDLPIIVLVASLSADTTTTMLRQNLGNLLLLERPIRMATLLSAVQTALRTRRRQYQVRLLTEVGQVLTASLNESTTLEQIATLIVPRLADVCTIYVREQDTLRRAAQAWSSQQHAEWAAELHQTSGPTSAAPIWQVIHEGVPSLRATITADALLTFVTDPKQREIIARIGVRSHLLMPLIAQGRAIGALALGMIQSERQFTEADLPFMRELTDRLAPALENLRLYEAEQHARAEAEQAITARDELLALVSHDLKNPLTTLLGQTQLLQRRVGELDGNADRFGRGLANIEHAALRMRTQISSLLDTIQLRAGQSPDLQRVSVDIVALVRAAVENCSQAAPKHAIRFETGCERLTVDLDTSRLERVLDNLLSNAVKYSPLGGAILVTLATEARSDDPYAVVRVQDWGLGIPADDLPHLFTPFRRAANVRNSIEGTGLGLASVREIVEAHNGWIDVQSTLGQGSTFTVALRLADANGAC